MWAGTLYWLIAHCHASPRIIFSRVSPCRRFFPLRFVVIPICETGARWWGQMIYNMFGFCPICTSISFSSPPDLRARHRQGWPLLEGGRQRRQRNAKGEVLCSHNGVSGSQRDASPRSRALLVRVSSLFHAGGAGKEREREAGMEREGGRKTRIPWQTAIDSVWGFKTQWFGLPRMELPIPFRQQSFAKYVH